MKPAQTLAMITALLIIVFGAFAISNLSPTGRVVEDNHAPDWTGDTSYEIDGTLTIDIADEFFDVDFDELSFSTNVPDGLSVEWQETNLVITSTPDFHHATLTLSAFDGTDTTSVDLLMYAPGALDVPDENETVELNDTIALNETESNETIEPELNETNVTIEPELNETLGNETNLTIEPELNLTINATETNATLNFTVTITDKNGTPLGRVSIDNESGDVRFDIPFSGFGIASVQPSAEFSNIRSDLEAKVDALPGFGLTTMVFAANPLDMDSATITLPKSSNVTSIVECSNFSLENFTCLSAFEPSGIPFIDNGDSVTFTTTHFSGFAGAGFEIQDAPAGAIGITNCTNLSDSTYYVLLNNVASNGTCFDTNTSNLVLDCNRTIITYGIQNSGTAFDVLNATNVTIKNCIIRDGNATHDLSPGINFTGTHNSTIFNNSIQTNGTTVNPGIWLKGSSNNTIQKNNIRTNGTNWNDGIRVEGTLGFNLVSFGLAVRNIVDYNTSPNKPGCNNVSGILNECKTCFNGQGVDCAVIGQGGCTDGEGFKTTELINFSVSGTPTGGRIEIIGGEVVTCSLNGNLIASIANRGGCGSVAVADLAPGVFVVGNNTLQCSVAGSGNEEDNGFKLSRFTFREIVRNINSAPELNSTNNIIRDNNISVLGLSNNNIGINIRNSPFGNLLLHNNITVNSSGESYGIYLTGNNSVLQNNTVRTFGNSTSSHALNLENAFNNSIFNNTLRANTTQSANGVRIIGGGSNTFSQNRFNTSANNSAAVDVFDSQNNIFINNTNNNTLAAYRLTDSLNTTFNTTRMNRTQNNGTKTLIIQEPFGIIEFTNSINISNITVLSDFITISNNGTLHVIRVNTTTDEAKEFNVSANLTFINTFPDGITPRVDNDDDNTFADCGAARCTKNNFGNVANGVFTFNVSSFSGYSLRNTTGCSTIDTDNTTFIPEADITGGTDCINIIGHNITLDCNSTIIRYDAVGSGRNGVNITNSSNVTVKNCFLWDITLAGTAVAVSSGVSGNVSIWNNTLRTNGTGGTGVSSTNPSGKFEIEKNNITGMGTGIGITSFTQSYAMPQRHLIFYNSLHTNGTGVSLNSVHYADITNNTINVSNTGLNILPSSDDVNGLNDSVFADNNISLSGGVTFPEIMYLQGVTNFTFRNNRINVSARSSSTVVIDSFVTHHILFENNLFVIENTSSTRAIDALNFFNAHNLRFIDNTVIYKGPHDEATTVFTDSGNNHSTFANNSFFLSNGNDSTVISADYNATIIGNYIEVNATEQSTAISGWAFNTIHNNTIIIRGKGPNFGILVYDNSTVTNNFINMTNGSAVGLTMNGDNINVSNNVFSMNGSSGTAIHIDDISSNITVNNSIINLFGTNSTGLDVKNGTHFYNTYLTIRRSPGSWIFVQDQHFTNLTNTTLNNSDGKIYYPQTISTPLISLGPLNVSTSYLNISSNLAYLNSTNLTMFNTSAFITLANLVAADPFPTVDLEDDGTFATCAADKCTEISYSDSIINFNVSSWTSFSTQDGGFFDEVTAYVSNCTNLSAHVTYKLLTNVSSNGTCFNFNISDATLDCNGTTITYGIQEIGAGVDIFNQTNVTVKNCIIQDGNATHSNSIGINLTGVANATIFNNTVRANGTTDNAALTLVSTVNTTILRNTLRTNATFDSDGIFSQIGLAAGSRIVNRSTKVLKSYTVVTYNGTNMNKPGCFNQSGTVIDCSFCMSNVDCVFVGQGGCTDGSNVKTDTILNFTVNGIVQDGTIEIIGGESATCYLNNIEIVRVGTNNNCGSIARGRLNNTMFVYGNNSLRCEVYGYGSDEDNGFKLARFIYSVIENSTVPGAVQTLALLRNNTKNTIENNTIIVTTQDRSNGLNILNSAGNSTVKNNIITISGTTPPTNPSIQNIVGINIEDGLEADIYVNNNITVNGTYGLYLGPSTNRTVLQNNTVRLFGKDARHAILLDSNTNATVSNNTFRVNGSESSSAVYILFGSDHTFNKNSFNTSTNFSVAVDVFNSPNNTFINNTVNHTYAAYRLINSLSTMFNTTRINRTQGNGTKTLIIEEEYGIIEFRDNLNISNLTRLSDFITISNINSTPLIRVNTTSHDAKAFNVSANLTFLNVFPDAIIPRVDTLDNGVFGDCDAVRCTTNNFGTPSNGVLSFNVSSFSGYSLRNTTGCSTLDIDNTTFIPELNMTTGNNCFTIVGENITVDCNNTIVFFDVLGNGKDAIIINETDNVTIKNCKFIDVTGATGRAAAIDGDNASNITVYNNTMLNVSDPVEITKIKGKYFIEKNHVSTNYTNGVAVGLYNADPPVPSFAYVYYNYLNHLGATFYLDGLSANHVANNTMYGLQGDSAIYLFGDPLVANNFYTNSTLIEENNVTMIASSISGYGIFVDAASNVTIRRNKLYTFATTRSAEVVSISDSKNITVENNDLYFEMNQESDVDATMFNRVENLLVAGNNITFNGSTNSGGIITYDLNNSLITGNRITANNNTEGAGITLYSSGLTDNNTVSNNFINVTINPFGFQMYGLEVYPSNSTIVNNTIIIVGDVGPFGDSEAYGIYEDGENDLFANNTIIIHNGTTRGMFIGGVNSTYTGNVITLNGSVSTGITIDHAAAEIENNTVNNTIIRLLGPNSTGLELANGTAFYNTHITLLNQLGKWINHSSGSNSQRLSNVTITNTTFNTTEGSIRFFGTINLNASNAGIVGRKFNSTSVNISQNLARVNSTNLTVFNTEAIITLTGLTFTEPQMVIDYEDDGSNISCSSSICTNISYNISGNQEFVFNVSHWTSFAVQEFTISNETAENATYLTDCTNLSTSGLYKLLNNVASNGTCFNFNASDATLDCNGTTIVYGIQEIGTGVNVFNRTNVTVKNCLILDGNATHALSPGINITRSTNTTIFNNTIRANGTSTTSGILITGSDNTTVQRNTIQVNGTTNTNGIKVQSSSTEYYAFSATYNHQLVDYTTSPNSPSCNNETGILNNCQTCFDTPGVDCAVLGQHGCTDGYGYKTDVILNFTTRGTILGGNIEIIGGESAICDIDGTQVISIGTNNYCGVFASASIPVGIVTPGNHTLDCRVTGYGSDEDNGFKLARFYLTENITSTSTIPVQNSTNAQLKDNTITVQGTSSNNGINIQNSLDGHLLLNNNITINASGTSYGVYLAGNSTTVQNNTVRTFGNATANHALRLTDAYRNHVFNNTLRANTSQASNAISISGGAFNTFIQNQFNATGNSSIAVDLSSTANNTFINNTINTTFASYRLTNSLNTTFNTTRINKTQGNQSKTLIIIETSGIIEFTGTINITNRTTLSDFITINRTPIIRVNTTYDEAKEFNVTANLTFLNVFPDAIVPRVDNDDSNTFADCGPERCTKANFGVFSNGVFAFNVSSFSGYTLRNTTGCVTIDTNESYIPESDIIAGTDCFQIRGQNLSLDCNGTTIYFDALGAGTEAIKINDSDNITIKNCRLIDLTPRSTLRGRGIDGSNSSNITAFNNTILNSTDGIILLDSLGGTHRIEQNTISGNSTLTGIAIELHTLLNYSVNAIINNNFVEHNDSTFYLEYISNVYFVNNTLRGMYDDAAVYMFGETRTKNNNSIFEDNIFNYTRGITNGGYGIYATDTNNLTIRRNQFIYTDADMDAYTIFVADAENFTVVYNNIFINKSTSAVQSTIYAQETRYGNISFNNISYNNADDLDGIEMQVSNNYTTIEGNKILGTNVTDSFILSAFRSAVGTVFNNLTLKHNYLSINTTNSNNPVYGLYISTSNSTIYNNTVILKGSGEMYGIYDNSNNTNYTANTISITTNRTPDDVYGIYDLSVNNSYIANSITVLNGTISGILLSGENSTYDGNNITLNGSLDVGIAISQSSLRVTANTVNNTIIRMLSPNSTALELGNDTAFYNTHITMLDLTGKWINNTDWSGANSARLINVNLTNTTFNSSAGSIRFPGLVNINASNSGIVGKHFNATSLNISQNLARINSTNLTGFNTSAFITLTGLTFSNPEVVVDYEDDGTNVTCPADVCTEVSYAGGEFTFNVSHWTSFAAQESVAAEPRTTAYVSNCSNISSANTDYVLLTSVFANRTCFDINVSGVSFDCNSSVITYGIQGIGTGIAVSNVSNITIKNCVIRDGNATHPDSPAINLTVVANSTIFNNTLQANGTLNSIGLRATGFRNGTISQNTIGANGSAGSYGLLLGYGVVIGTALPRDSIVDYNTSINAPGCANQSGNVVSCKTCFTGGGVNCAVVGQGGCTDGEGFKTETILNFTLNTLPTQGYIEAIGGEQVTCSLNGNTVLTISTRNNCGAFGSASIPQSAFTTGENALVCSVAGAGDDEDNGFKLVKFTYSTFTTGQSTDISYNNNVTRNIIRTNSTGVTNSHGIVAREGTHSIVFADNTITANNVSDAIQLENSERNRFINNTLNYTRTGIRVIRGGDQYLNTSFIPGISSLVIDELNGILEFTGPLNISNGTNLTIVSNVTINSVWVNTSRNDGQQLNQTARLTFLNIYPAAGRTLAAVVDLEDDGVFANCGATRCINATLNGSRFIYNVTSFTNYSTTNSSACDTFDESGSYLLNGNVSASGTCFNILADNVSLDCSGYTITYGTGGLNGSIGINVTDARNVTIHNCIINGSNISNGHGIALKNGTLTRISNTTITTQSYDSHAIVLESSMDVTLRNNTLLPSAEALWVNGSNISHWETHDINGSNTAFGLNISYFGGAGNSPGCPTVLTNPSTHHITLVGCTNVTLTQFVAGDAITLVDTNLSTVSHSHSVRNKNGVRLMLSFNDTILNSTLTTNGTSFSYGLYVFKGGNHQLTRNNISVNATSQRNYGVFTEYSSGSIIENATISTNARGERNYGIHVFKSNITSIWRSDITANGSSNTFGVQIDNGTDFRIENSTIRTQGFSTNPAVSLDNFIRNAFVDGNTLLPLSRRTSASGTNAYGVVTALSTSALTVISNVTVSRNFIVTNSTAGFSVGVWMYGAQNSSITDNTMLTGDADSTANHGIFLEGSRDITVLRNDINVTGYADGFGGYLDDSNNTYWENNTLRTLTIFPPTQGGFIANNYGFFLTLSANNTFIGSFIYANATEESSGIVLEGSRNNTFDRTYIRTNLSESADFPHAIQMFPTGGVSSNGTRFNNTYLANPGAWFYYTANSYANLTNTTFENARGSIQVPGSFVLNASSTTQLLITDLNTSSNRSFISAASFAYLNQSAVIRLNLTGLGYTQPDPIMAHGSGSTYVSCPVDVCTEIGFSNSVFTFNVSHWTSFAAQDVIAAGDIGANVTLNKTDGPDPATAGTIITYNLTVNNNGSTTIFNITVNETYPPQAIFLNASPVPIGSNNGTFNITSLAPYAIWQINITLNVSTSVVNNTLINNTANLTYTNSTGTTFSNITTAQTLILNPNIVNSTVLNCTVTNSTINNSVKLNCTIINAFIFNSNNTNSTIINSNETNSTDINTFVNASVIINSFKNNSNITNSTVINSTINNCVVFNSTINSSTKTNCTILNSTNNGCTVTNSTETSTTCTNSTKLNSTNIGCILLGTFENSSTCNSSTKINSTVVGSTDINCNVTNSTELNVVCINSNLTNTTKINSTNIGCTINSSFENATTCINSTKISSIDIDSNITNSTVTNSSIINCNVTNSNITNSFKTDCVITSSNVFGSNNTNSTIINSTEINSTDINTIVINSTILNAYKNNSQINNSNITNSSIIDCIVINSVVIDSIKANCTIINSTIVGSNNTNTTTINTIERNSTDEDTRVINSSIIFSFKNGSFINSTNLTNSTVITSNLTNSTVINSTITNSTLNNCTVINSTIIGAVFSGCSFLNLYYPNLTGVNITVNATSSSGIQGTGVPYTITIGNNGTNTHTYNLTINNIDNATTATLSQYNITIAGNSVGTVTLTVTDSNTTGVFTVTVTAVSISNTSINATTAIISTTVNTPPAGPGGGGGGGGSCTPSWSCTGWSGCSSGTQTRTCIDSNSCGTTSGQPAQTQSCSCTEDWVCDDWSSCNGGTQTRNCQDANSCGTFNNEPDSSQSCTEPAQPQTETPGLTGNTNVRCGNLSRTNRTVQDIERSTVDITALIPKGYKLAAPAFQVNCDGGSIDLTLQAPDTFKDLRILRCTENTCVSETIISREVNAQTCNNRTLRSRTSDEETSSTGLISPEQVTTTLTEYKKLTRGESITVRNYAFAAEGITARITGLTQPIPAPLNPSLAMIGTPLVIELESVPTRTVPAQITLPVPTATGIEQGSIQVFAFVNRSWVPLNGIRNGNSISVAFQDIKPYLVGRTGTFATMGVTCTACSTAAFERQYAAETRTAIVLVHGAFSNKNTYDNIIEDFRIAQQPFDIWTYDYPSNNTLEDLSTTLADALLLHTNRYDNIYLVGHSAGGLIVQQALRTAYNRGDSTVPKVRKAILIGSPTGGSPTVEAIANLLNYAINHDTISRVFNVNSRLIQETVAGKEIEPVPGVDYRVIAGTKPYDFNLGFFRLSSEQLVQYTIKNDGIVSIESAQKLGKGYVNDPCKDYYEVNLTHTELIDNPAATRVLERIITRDYGVSTIEQPLVGQDQYIRFTANDCRPTDQYALIGIPIRSELAADAVCGCGNGWCGEGETATNCPADCANILTIEKLCITTPLAATLILIAFATVALTFGFQHYFRRKQMNVRWLYAGSSTILVTMIIIGLLNSICRATNLIIMLAMLILAGCFIAAIFLEKRHKHEVKFTPMEIRHAHRGTPAKPQPIQKPLSLHIKDLLHKKRLPKKASADTKHYLENLNEELARIKRDLKERKRYR